MSGDSSARPDALIGLQRWTQGISEALDARASTLTNALQDYYDSCQADHVCHTDLDGALRQLASRMGRLGAWTAAVGKAFQAADATAVQDGSAAIDVYTGQSSGSGISVPDAAIVASLPAAWRGSPLLGDKGTSTPVDWAKWQKLDSQWLTDLSYASDTGSGAQTIAKAWEITFPDGEHFSAAIKAGRQTADDVTKWVGHVSTAISFVSGAATTWSVTAGQGEPLRLAESIGGGGVSAISWGMGFAAGTAVFSETGPFAPIFGAVTGFVVSSVASIGYNQLIGTTVPQKIDQLGEEISNPAPASVSEGATVQLNADRQALQDTASKPALHQEVESETSPTMPLLSQAAGETAPEPESAGPPTGTTTTTVPPAGPSSSTPPATPSKSPPGTVPPKIGKERIQAAVPGPD